MPVKGVPGKMRAWVGSERPCAYCATDFVPKHPNARYCGVTCRGLARRAARVSEKRRLRIYERDNWTCYLCGEPCERGGPDAGMYMASLDHVTPIGDRPDPSDDDNLRTAHYICNARKSAKSLADLGLEAPGVASLWADAAKVHRQKPRGGKRTDDLDDATRAEVEAACADLLAIESPEERVMACEQRLEDILRRQNELFAIRRNAVQEMRKTMSLSKVAEELGVSRTRVQQLETRGR